MDLNKRSEYERLIEITYYYLLQHIRSKVPSNSFFLFIESFCRVFDIDYTQISTVNSMFLKRLKPSKYEVTLHAVLTNSRLSDLGRDYRTIRSHRKKYEKGEFELYPRISNFYMIEEMRVFINRYISLYDAESSYMFDFIKDGGLSRALTSDDIYGGTE